MGYKRHTGEDVDRILNEIEQDRANGIRLLPACNRAGITDSTYYLWRRRKRLSQPAQDNGELCLNTDRRRPAFRDAPEVARS